MKKYILFLPIILINLTLLHASEDNSLYAEYLGKIDSTHSFDTYLAIIEDDFDGYNVSAHNKLSKQELRDAFVCLSQYDYEDGEVYEIAIKSDTSDIVIICAEITNHRKSLNYKAWSYPYYSLFKDSISNILDDWF